MRAILGRETLGVAETRRMLAAENVFAAQRGFSRAENGAEWAAHHPDLARALTWAERARAETDTNGE